MNRLEEYGYAGLYKALKHKYKYALSTNLPCVSRRSQFLALLCIFPELISLQDSRVLSQSFSSQFSLFGCLKCFLLLIFRHTLEIINDHPSLVVKVEEKKRIKEKHATGLEPETHRSKARDLDH